MATGSKSINQQDRNRIKVVHTLQAVKKLTVGDSSDGYGEGNQAWIDADGENPPTFAAIRLIDQTTGEAVVVTVNDGALELDGGGND